MKDVEIETHSHHFEWNFKNSHKVSKIVFGVFPWKTIQTSGSSSADSTRHTCSREMAFWMGRCTLYLSILSLLGISVTCCELECAVKWELRHSGECVSNNQVAQCNFGVKHGHDLRSYCPPAQPRSMTQREGTQHCFHNSTGKQQR